MAASSNDSTFTPPIIRPQGGQGMSLSLLPTRGEKQLIPSPLAPDRRFKSLTKASLWASLPHPKPLKLWGIWKTISAYARPWNP